MRAALALALILGCGFSASACSSLTSYEPETYVVRSGDTLYSIAWRHGLDHRDLARWNGLADPSRIYVGQRLTLAPRTASASVSRPASAATPRASTPPAASRGSPATRPAAASGSSRTSAGSPGASAGPASRPSDNRPPVFSWPTEGSVAARFGERGVLTTGIGIAGRIGQDVVAAAPGRVVYAGRGLPDYGQLVIIEHNESWLTAYGHNRSLLVAQGDTVARGEKIGEMGEGPGREPRLYFEIRRDGTPLDPLDLLPRSN